VSTGRRNRLEKSKIRGTVNVGIVPILHKADVSQKENLFSFSFLPRNAFSTRWRWFGVKECTKIDR
jgi:hypothetical protein